MPATLEAICFLAVGCKAEGPSAPIATRVKVQFLGPCSAASSNGNTDTTVATTPKNFHQTSTADLGNGDLYFTYAWESSTGNLADLSSWTGGRDAVGKVLRVPHRAGFARGDFLFLPAGRSPGSSSLCPLCLFVFSV